MWRESFPVWFVLVWTLRLQHTFFPPKLALRIVQHPPRITHSLPFTMEWNGVPQAASLQQGPWSNWVLRGNLHACNDPSYLRSQHCEALLSKCVSSFHDSLVRHVLSPQAHRLDAVILAIDIEDAHFPHPPNKIGIATLDMRILFDSSIPPSQKIHTKFLHRMTWASFLRSKRPPYAPPKAKYLFSHREQFYRRTVLHTLKSIFTHEGRDVILLGHETHVELHHLASMGFSPDQHASISGVLDTKRIAANVFKQDKDTKQRLKQAGHQFRQLGLGNMLKELGFVGKEFHNAGNDANFTLRALLLLMAYELDGDWPQWTQDTGARVEMLRSIALVPLPGRPNDGPPPKLSFKNAEIAEENRRKRDAQKPVLEWYDMDLADAFGQLES